MKKWRVPKRNWDKVQFEKLRRKIDPKFNEVHDVLSKAFYEGKPFTWKGKNWGILDKTLFDKLHGLIFLLRDLAFHEANMSLSSEERIEEDEYNIQNDEQGNLIKRSNQTLKNIHNLKKKGIELEI